MFPPAPPQAVGDHVNRAYLAMLVQAQPCTWSHSRSPAPRHAPRPPCLIPSRAWGRVRHRSELRRRGAGCGGAGRAGEAQDLRRGARQAGAGGLRGSPEAVRWRRLASSFADWPHRSQTAPCLVFLRRLAVSARALSQGRERVKERLLLSTWQEVAETGLEKFKEAASLCRQVCEPRAAYNACAPGSRRAARKLPHRAKVAAPRTSRAHPGRRRSCSGRWTRRRSATRRTRCTRTPPSAWSRPALARHRDSPDI